MTDFLRRNVVFGLVLRALVPLATAVVLGIWVADVIGGAGGVILGVILAVAVLALGAVTGVAGDAARAGRARIEIPPTPRLAGEALLIAAAVIALAAGLGSIVLAILLALAGLLFFALRIGDMPAKDEPSAPVAPAAPAAAPASAPRPTASTTGAGGTAAAGTATSTAPQADTGPAEWSKRGAQGSFQFGRVMTVNAPVSDVWKFVWDFEQLAACIPGCEEVEEHEAHKSYTARVRKKLGPFLIRMPLEIDIQDFEEERSIRAAVVGRDQRMRSEVNQQLDVTLVEVPEGCQVRAVIDVTIQGVLASVDATLIERNLDQTIGEFTTELNARISSTATGTGPR